MTEQGHAIPPLRAGRRPAGAALLGWLDDDRSPRLCRISGSPGSGKTHLLEWLIQAGGDERTPERRRLHAVFPATGASVRGAVWALGHQLGVVARSPGDLLTALAESDTRTVVCVPGLNRAVDPARLVAELLDPLLRLPRVRLLVEAEEGSPEALGLTAVEQPAVLDLDQPQWTDRARYDAWCAGLAADPAGYPSPGAALGHARPDASETVARLAARVPRLADGAPDPAAAGEQLLSDLWTATTREGSTGQLLADPPLLTYAGPLAVTAALEGTGGPIPTAWDVAGPALIAEPDPGVRAALLRTRLLGLDDVAAERLAAVPGPWRGAWALWPNSSIGWPGAVASLAVGAGAYAGQLLLADPGGTIRTVQAQTGVPLARVTTPGPKPLRALAVASDGSVLLLDAWGGLEVLPAPGGAPGRASAVAGPLDALRGGVESGMSALAVVPGPSGSVPVVADESGSLHWYQDGAVLGERLHAGPVTALAGASADGRAVLVSGGFDGTVRLWSPGTPPNPEPLDRRAGPVGAVAAAGTPDGAVVAAAWGDGLVRVFSVGRPEPVLELRLGSQVWALALAEGRVVLGTSDGIAAVEY
ncbi:WD40 repeat domain-containing protein [Kitasatospora sp. NPDC056138]|uniref:WD40 repeat domain-containing protein n=1 Tax=Kitasatospora sp. NPDC056138 TaxID=3345724 RepID=UPI0035D6F5AE